MDVVYWKQPTSLRYCCAVAVSKLQLTWLSVVGLVNYRISSNSSRASNTGRVSNRSPVFVYSVLYSQCIVGIRVPSTVQPVYCWYPCTQYCTAGVLLVFVYCTAGVRAIGVNRRRASNTGRGSEPFVPIDAGGFYSRKYGSLHENICLLFHYLLQCAKLPNLKVIDGWV